MSGTPPLSEAAALSLLDRAQPRLRPRVRPVVTSAKRVLVAEDEDSIRTFVTRTLQHAGYHVTAVGDGLAALAMLAEAPFDLLLTDIVMPEMDGIALALKATQAYPAMRILMMTGYAAERQRAHNLEALIHEVLAKPFSLDQMLCAVREALDRKL